MEERSSSPLDSTNDRAVLIVDDSLNDADAAECILRDSGFSNIRKVSRMDEAIHMIKQEQIDLVVLDLGGLPDITEDDPLAAPNKLRKEFPGVDIVVLSGNKNPRVRKEAEAQGWPYVLKDEALNLGFDEKKLPNILPEVVFYRLQQSNQTMQIEIEKLQSSVRALDDRMHQWAISLFSKGGQISEEDARRITIMNAQINKVGDELQKLQNQVTSFTTVQERLTIIETRLTAFNLDRFRDVFGTMMSDIELLKNDLGDRGRDISDLRRVLEKNVDQVYQAQIAQARQQDATAKVLELEKKLHWLIDFLTVFNTGSAKLKKTIHSFLFKRILIILLSICGTALSIDILSHGNVRATLIQIEKMIERLIEDPSLKD